MNEYAITLDAPTRGADPTSHDIPDICDKRAGVDRSPTSSAILALIQALSLSNQAVLRCKWQYGIALHCHSPHLAAAALGHANEARIHAHRIVDRIMALGGETDALHDGAPAGSLPHRNGEPLATIILDQLLDARSTVQCYRKIAAYLAPFDPETASLIADIVVGEEACASELADVLDEEPARLAP